VGGGGGYTDLPFPFWIKLKLEKYKEINHILIPEDLEDSLWHHLLFSIETHITLGQSAKIFLNCLNVHC
jgi:hypothetical protein